MRRRFRQRPHFRTSITNSATPLATPQTITARTRAREAMRTEHTAWYRIENRASGAATIYLYSEIGFWGVTADDFVKDLADVKGSTIDLRINSEGGEVFDGITIFNALRNHAATVNVTVDGLAASAASFIAMAGDTITMDRGSQMMIHDAQTVALGNAEAMRNTADLLDKASNTIASFYAERAGGTVADWRKTMAKDTWYTAEEAVAAGLADSCVSANLTKDDDSSAGKATRDAAPTAPIVAALESSPTVIDDRGEAIDAVDDQNESDLLDWPSFDPAAFRAGLTASIEPEPLPFSAELFRAAMACAASDVAAPDAPHKPPVLVEADLPRVDPAMFHRALREATL